MSSAPEGENWWRASDGRWYPPGLHPEYQATRNLPEPPPGYEGRATPPGGLFTPQPIDPLEADGRAGRSHKPGLNRSKIWWIAAAAAAAAVAIAVAGTAIGVARRDEDQLSTGTEQDEPTTVSTTTTTTTAPLDPMATAEWETSIGWRYRATLSWAGSSAAASPLGCIEVPPPSEVNRRFNLKIENLVEDRSAPMPQMIVGSNLEDEPGPGRITTPPSTPSSESYPELNRPEKYPDGPWPGYRDVEVELDETKVGTSCDDANVLIQPESYGEDEGVIPPGGEITIGGVLADVPDPAPTGLALMADFATGSPESWVIYDSVIGGQRSIPFIPDAGQRLVLRNPPN